MKLQVGVKALIQNDKGEYLLLRRAEVMTSESETHWDIPGGRIEPEEALHDALRREVLEETGIKLSDEPELLAAQDIFVSAINLHVVRLTYRLKGQGEVVLSHEHQETRWVLLEDALTLNLDSYLREVLSKQKNT